MLVKYFLFWFSLTILLIIILFFNKLKFFFIYFYLKYNDACYGILNFNKKGDRI